MSKNLTNAAVIEFDAEVKHEYQGKAKLRKTVTIRTGVRGESYKFTRMGKGIANQKASAADVTPMDISHDRQTATMSNWEAPEYTDIFDAQEVNFDEKQELAQTIAGAIGRREDQTIIDAMLSGTITYAATNDQNPDTGRILDISGTRNFDVAAVRTALQHLEEIEADSSDRHILVRPAAMSEMLDDTEVTGADYVSVKALINGEFNTYLGFTWHKVGVRAEGGLPGVAADRIAYAYHKPSIGIAIGIDMKTTIDWVPTKTAWLANGLFKAGSVVREPQGIIAIQYNETT